MRCTPRPIRMMVALTLLAATACGTDATGPAPTDPLAGRWEGVSQTGIAYVYVFTATGQQDETSPRTGNPARVYDLSYSTAPGGSGSTEAYREASVVYWGATSTGTIVDDSTMSVEADTVAPFLMRRR